MSEYLNLGHPKTTKNQIFGRKLFWKMCLLNFSNEICPAASANYLPELAMFMTIIDNPHICNATCLKRNLSIILEIIVTWVSVEFSFVLHWDTMY